MQFKRKSMMIVFNYKPNKILIFIPMQIILLLTEQVFFSYLKIKENIKKSQTKNII